MIKLNTYYVSIDKDNVVISTSRTEGTYRCENLFDKLATILRKARFELVYVSKTDHEEEAYQKDDYIVILLYKHCIIKTNLPQDKLLEFIKMSKYIHDATGAI